MTKNPMHIYLVGLRCCGKSTIGKIVASRLGVPFLDGDCVTNEFLRGTGYAGGIGQVTAPGVYTNGWEIMRLAELAGIAKTCSEYKNSGLVFALGGGAVAHDLIAFREANISILSKWGSGFYLTPSAERAVVAQDLGMRIHADNERAKSCGDMSTYRHPMFVKERDFASARDAQIADVGIAFERRDKLYQRAAQTVFTAGLKSEEVADIILQRVALK